MRRVSFFVVIAVVMVLSSCNMLGVLMNQSLDDGNSGSRPVETNLERVVVESDSFTLAWDDDSSESVAQYTVFYRVHGTDSWAELATVLPSDGLQLEIDETILG